MTARRANVAQRTNDKRSANDGPVGHLINSPGEFIFGLTCPGAYVRSFKSEICEQTKLSTSKESVLFS